MKEKQDKKSHRPEATADPSEQQAMAANNNTPSPSDEIPDGRRRRLLKNTSIGALASLAVTQLPKHWQQPVVNSVVLPAHAQMSPAMPMPLRSLTGAQVGGFSQSFPVSGLIPPASSTSAPGAPLLPGMSRPVPVPIPPGTLPPMSSPMLTNVVVDDSGDSIRLFFTFALDRDAVPSPDDFTVVTGRDTREVVSVAILETGTTVELQVSPAIIPTTLEGTVTYEPSR